MFSLYRNLVRRVTGAAGRPPGTRPGRRSARRRWPQGASRQKQAAAIAPLLAAAVLTATLEPHSANAMFDRSGERLFAREATASADNRDEGGLRRRPPHRFQVY